MNDRLDANQKIGGCRGKLERQNDESRFEENVNEGGREVGESQVESM